jgi:hypothetical protein
MIDTRIERMNTDLIFVPKIIVRLINDYYKAAYLPRTMLRQQH